MLGPVLWETLLACCAAGLVQQCHEGAASPLPPAQRGACFHESHIVWASTVTLQAHCDCVTALVCDMHATQHTMPGSAAPAVGCRPQQRSLQSHLCAPFLVSPGRPPEGLSPALLMATRMLTCALHFKGTSSTVQVHQNHNRCGCVSFAQEHILLHWLRPRVQAVYLQSQNR